MSDLSSSSLSSALTRVIPDEWLGLRVDKALAQLFPDYSRTQLGNWLKSGRLTLTPPVHKLNEKIQGGESVTLNPPDIVEIKTHLPEAIDLDIIYEDDDCLIINKPAGLIVHPGAGNRLHTLLNALLHHAPSLQHLPRAGIVHRLDKDTTGLLVIAKTEIAYTDLVRQMQARDIQRHYVTLVYGHIIAGGVIHTHYGRHPTHRLKMAVTPNGREAITHYTIRAHLNGLTLLNVKLETGRTHQIRVHMAHINHPVVGDQLYSGRKRGVAGLSLTAQNTLSQFKRQALHAHTLTFQHPTTQQPMTFTAPIPHDLQTVLDALS